MGQQESRGGSPALVKRAADLRTQESYEGGDTTPRGPSNRRMEKLLTRARGALDRRKREQQYAAQGSPRDSGSEGVPTPERRTSKSSAPVEKLMSPSVQTVETVSIASTVSEPSPSLAGRMVAPPRRKNKSSSSEESKKSPTHEKVSPTKPSIGLTKVTPVNITSFNIPSAPSAKPPDEAKKKEEESPEDIATVNGKSEPKQIQAPSARKSSKPEMTVVRRSSTQKNKEARDAFFYEDMENISNSESSDFNDSSQSQQKARTNSCATSHSVKEDGASGPKSTNVQIHSRTKSTSSASSPEQMRKRRLVLPEQNLNSGLSSPSDDVFTDAATDPSPLDSPYLSAESRNDNTTSTGEDTSSPDEIDTIKIDFEEDLDGASTTTMRFSSIDSLSKSEGTSPRPHRPVEAIYPVATSRLLSASDSPRTRSASSTSADLSSTTPVGRGTVGSEGEMSQSMIEASYSSVKSKHDDKCHPAKHSISVDSGLETATDSRTDLMNNAGRHLKNSEESSTDSERKEEEGSQSARRRRRSRTPDHEAGQPTKYNTISGSPRRRSVGDPNNSLSGGKKKTRHMSEDDCSPRICNKKGTQSVPSTPTGDTDVFTHPPSRTISLEHTVKVPISTPEKLNFSQLEKFEGMSQITK